MIVYRVLSDTNSFGAMIERCRVLTRRRRDRRRVWIGTMDDRVWDLDEVSWIGGGRVLLAREDRGGADGILRISRRSTCNGIEVTKIITRNWEGRAKEYLICAYEGYAFHVASRRYLLTPATYGHEPEDV